MIYPFAFAELEPYDASRRYRHRFGRVTDVDIARNVGAGVVLYRRILCRHANGQLRCLRARDQGLEDVLKELE